MYPTTKFDLVDKSQINLPVTPTEDTLDRPVYFLAITSDKGPEDFRTVMGKPFFKLYGDKPSFAKHGQPLLQAANAINSGGRLFTKRVVAEDARLANIGLVAKVSKITSQKVDGSGNPLYTTPSGAETTDPIGNTPIMLQKCGIAYELRTVNISGNEPAEFAAQFLTANAHTNTIGQDGEYPLFLIMDNGRGVSGKKFRITPNFTANRTAEYVKYLFETIENNEVTESMQFTMNPNIIEANSNLSLQSVMRDNSIQLRGRIFEDEINAMIENVCYISGDTDGAYAYQDMLFGRDIRGNKLQNIEVDTTVNVSNIYGVSLVGGDNGLFGTAPIIAGTYTTEILKVYNGTFDDVIYDIDNVRIDVVPDADFASVIKRAIEDFVEFRQDCQYLRDLGKGLKSIAEIKLANTYSSTSKFCMTYQNSWDVIDPYSKKQITVTAPYNLVNRFTNHFLNGRTRPFCGLQYEITFPEVIEGTVNFIPKITPSLNQKQTLDDMRVNYASYYNNLLTMETEYTSQTEYTQLSFGNNMFAVQELIKAIRVKCPKIRYTFLDGDDLKRYKEDVEAVINQFVHKFLSIELKYAEDDVTALYASNKIFYAVIEIKFRNFVQSELFKVIALAS